MSIIQVGTPLVLINAFPVDRHQWDPMLEQLAEFNAPIGDIITFDVPGIGEMPIPDEEPSLELVADAATLAMQEVTGYDAAIWVGCSMGGYIAMAVAERHPDAIAGLVLVGTKASADNQEGREKRLDLARKMEHLDQVPDPLAMAQPLVGTQGESRAELVEWVRANIAKHSGAGIAWGQRAMASRPDRLEVLRGLDVPAVVMRGANDGIATSQEADAMAEALGVEAQTVGGVGHLTALESPQAVAEAVAQVAHSVNVSG